MRKVYLKTLVPFVPQGKLTLLSLQLTDLSCVWTSLWFLFSALLPGICCQRSPGIESADFHVDVVDSEDLKLSLCNTYYFFLWCRDTTYCKIYLVLQKAGAHSLCTRSSSRYFGIPLPVLRACSCSPWKKRCNWFYWLLCVNKI